MFRHNNITCVSLTLNPKVLIPTIDNALIPIETVKMDSKNEHIKFKS